MRRGLKRTVEWLLARGGPASLGRRRVRGRGLVLAYHNVVPEGAEARGDRSLHLAEADFARQLDELVRHCRVVPLEEIFDAGRRGPPRVAITFDDAYRGAVTAGLARVASLGLPATVFVAPAYLGDGGRDFWWDALAGRDSLSPAEREDALTRCRGEDAAIRLDPAWRGRESTPLPSHARAASLEELQRAASQPGVVIAAHTWSHPNLARLTDDEVRDELRRPMAWLAERFGASYGPWLAYPYGRTSPAVSRIAAEVGYRAAFRVDGGWMPLAATLSHDLPRFNVPAGLSLDGFRLRLAGLLAA